MFRIEAEMFSLPKTPILAVGLLEALGAASGMAAGGTLYVTSIEGWHFSYSKIGSPDIFSY